MSLSVKILERSKRAIVIYDSRFGNTKKVAECLKTGLENLGVNADCFGINEMKIETLKNYDLICVGAPTEIFTSTVAMKEFLARLGTTSELEGKFGFAFDTKVSPVIFGSSARFIENHLKKDLGLEIIVPHESAIVRSTHERGKISGAALQNGEECRFEEIGKILGSILNGSLIVPEAIVI